MMKIINKMESSYKQLEHDLDRRKKEMLVLSESKQMADRIMEQ